MPRAEFDPKFVQRFGDLMYGQDDPLAEFTRPRRAESGGDEYDQLIEQLAAAGMQAELAQQQRSRQALQALIGGRIEERRDKRRFEREHAARRDDAERADSMERRRAAEQFVRDKELMQLRNPPEKSPADQLRNQMQMAAAEQAALRGNQAEAIEYAEGKRNFATSPDAVQAGAPHWEQEERRIWDDVDANPTLNDPEKLADRYGELMDNIRRAHPGDDGERLARQFGESLSRHLYETLPNEFTNPFERKRQAETIARHKERMYGAGQAGVATNDVFMFGVPEVESPERAELRKRIFRSAGMAPPARWVQGYTLRE